MQNQPQDQTPRLFSYQSSCHHPSQYFFESPSHASFLVVSSISFWSYIFWSMTCCFRSSSRHAIQVGVSRPKIIYLYPVMVSLMDSSSSSFVFIQFRRGKFNFFASSNSDVFSFIISFVTPSRIQKSFWPSIYTSKNPSSLSSLSMLHCWFPASVYFHSSTYAWGW